FVKGDVRDGEFLQKLFSDYKLDSVIHLAADSNFDRSISNPIEFVMTNVIGTVNLLNAAKKNWLSSGNQYPESNIFYHVSTDEVYGSLGSTGFFTEGTAYDPHSPYSAS